jgi:hypothetical protein
MVLSLLDSGIPTSRVDEEVAEAWLAHGRAAYTLCIGLFRLHRDRVHRDAGFSRFVDYADFRWGIPVKLAGLFAFLGSHFERLPRTRAAVESGELSYTKAREFVSLANPGTEEDWIEFARHHSNRALEQEVRRVRAERDGEENVTVKVIRTPLTAKQTQQVRLAREMLAKESQCVREEELLPKLLDLFIDGRLGATKSQGHEAHLSIQLCPACVHAFIPVPAANIQVDLSKWVEQLRMGAEVHNFLQDQLCACREVKHRRDECPEGWVPSKGAAGSRHVPAELQREIQARDGFRCRVPGCGNYLLENGHMETPFSEGAPMSREHLGLQCATCNRLIEKGRLRIVGHAPYEKYYLSDGTFLGWGFDPEPFEHENPHVGKCVDGASERPAGS